MDQPERTFENISATSDSYRMAMGIDRELSPGWRPTGGIAYNRIDDSTSAATGQHPPPISSASLSRSG